MKTIHNVFFKDSRDMSSIAPSSVHLVVTSPPYPMIEMWDDTFALQNKNIAAALKGRNGLRAFELMHRELDKIWGEIFRILTNGGIACINIGDATRTIDGNFMLYPNHSRIHSALLKTGFLALPLILWRKATNAPNKFMGSGMLPPGAYVTLEHEYILVLRKGSKREFDSPQQKQTRRESSFFWEERNQWFSDVWMDLIGTRQKMTNKKIRHRSGAFPFELAYRLINMFSVKGDTVVDPFLGTGTTMWAAIAAGRKCIGYEIETAFRDEIFSPKEIILQISNQRIRERIQNHLEFVQKRTQDGGGFKYRNRCYGFPVITRQEVELFINPLVDVKHMDDDRMIATYTDVPDQDCTGNWEDLVPSGSNKSAPNQLTLF